MVSRIVLNSFRLQEVKLWSFRPHLITLVTTVWIQYTNENYVELIQGTVLWLLLVLVGLERSSSSA